MTAIKACAGEVTNLEGVVIWSHLPGFRLRHHEHFRNEIDEGDEEKQRLTWILYMHREFNSGLPLYSYRGYASVPMVHNPI
jgi:hypothetical protein